jgi:hypothetical protein
MKKNLWIMSLALLSLSALCGLSINTIEVSALEYPAIYVIPNFTWDESLSPGVNYTVSIYTNYSGSDVWAYQFTLSFNQNVLRGGVNKTDTWVGDGTTRKFYTTYTPVIQDSEYVYLDGVLMTDGVDYIMDYRIGEVYFSPFDTPADGANITAIYLYGVVNGDLITEDKDPSARFDAGVVNNTLGKLSLTKAYFFYTSPDDPYVTSGPGILANVTFTVVGYGTSNVTIGAETKLIGYNSATHSVYNIIDASIQLNHIQHGFFSNLIPGDVGGDTPGTPPDGDVDRYDFGFFAAAYGSSVGDPNFNPLADLTGDTTGSPPDGDVDRYDFGVFAGNYGRTI